MKRLRLVGVSHRTAPVEWRERLAVPDDRLPALVERLRARAAVEEAVVLSTCNRVEVYAVTEADDAVRLRGEVAQWHSDPRLAETFYQHDDDAAVRHLFRVAAGLDSLVIGEAEILGQVRRAYDLAKQAGATGKLTNVLFQRAMYVGKAVRTQTKISEGPTSVPSLAVSLAERIFGDLAACRALVVGAGAMAELALRALKSQKVAELVVANRTAEKAAALAQAIGARAALFADLSKELARADIVLCSTGSPEFIFREPQVAAALHERRGRSLFFIDIAVPRDVDPAVDALDNVYLYNVDDLEGLVAESRGRRETEILRAGSLADVKAGEFAPWYESWRAGVRAALRHGDRDMATAEMEANG
ncbi:MAG: glutamyl-tRNA reductase [Elusimicrobia bacterium]|jgi:glutamyl-tRNA reductase|nr:glutamyl-tRNA reductase [Elusimicrobiota bacterium]MBK7544430.1 glutamyl-tRNA reductase [Elusimicrobiota bacterium]MBK9922893.1 glutamyl-tRNA reductase [Elusimicrobiota bacterium]MBL0249315.1 glutamyl-tRNA reductase [Elusimicrobiota bacterium]MBP8004232.1 glutamyl-tRNA reductase [Elusimicrobiota bacterium]